MVSSVHMNLWRAVFQRALARGGERTQSDCGPCHFGATNQHYKSLHGGESRLHDYQ